VAEAGRQAERPLRSAVVYSLGYALQRAIGFLMLPVYTRAIAPAKYGLLGVLVSVAAAAAIVFAAGLESAITRAYFQFEHDPVRRERYVQSVWRFLVVFPFAGALLLTTLAWPFLHALAGVRVLDLLLALMGAATYVAATTVPLTILRARQALRPYLILTFVTALTTPACAALFVVVFDGGVRGFLLATVVANAATLLVALRVMPWRRHVRLDTASVRDSLKLGMPLVPHFFSHWALQLADRLVLAGLVSAAALGVYSLAANIAAPALVILMSLNWGFMPTYARAGADAAVKPLLRRTVTLQVALVVTITLGGMLLGASVVEIMAPPEYHGAGPLVAWLVLGYGFLGLYYIPMNGATLGVGRTAFAWVASSASAGVNIALLFALVPSHGIRWAAIASALGYLALLLLIGVYAHAKPNPVTYDWRRLVPLMALAGLVYAVATATTPHGQWAALAARTMWWAAFAGLVAAAGTIGPLGLRDRSAAQAGALR
jgi:O-antigen/teichoic acid export membrane protein